MFLQKSNSWLGDRFIYRKRGGRDWRKEEGSVTECFFFIYIFFIIYLFIYYYYYYFILFVQVVTILIDLWFWLLFCTCTSQFQHVTFGLFEDFSRFFDFDRPLFGLFSLLLPRWSTLRALPDEFPIFRLRIPSLRTTSQISSNFSLSDHRELLITTTTDPTTR